MRINLARLRERTATVNTTEWDVMRQVLAMSAVDDMPRALLEAVAILDESRTRHSRHAPEYKPSEPLVIGCSVLAQLPAKTVSALDALDKALLHHFFSVKSLPKTLHTLSPEVQEEPRLCKG